MVFIIFFAYFFVTSSIVAFEDGFDETVKQKGYPNDFQEASQWTPIEYIIWATSWMPKEKQDKLLNFIQKEPQPEDGVEGEAK